MSYDMTRHAAIAEKLTTPSEGGGTNNNPLSPDVKLFFPGEKLKTDVADVANVASLDLSQAIDAACLIIDAALRECADNPGILGSAEFIEAVQIISSDRAAWFEYRTKIKAAKPSGVPMAAIDSMAQQPSEDNRQDSTASELIALVMNSCTLFFDENADKSFITTDIDGVTHTLAIGSKAFIEWLSFTYYSATKQGFVPGKSASEAAIKQASFALAGIAKHEGENRRVHLRVADHGGGHYLFIGDDRLRVIEVLPSGWRIIENPPVLFWQPGSMQSLPTPQPGGDLSQLWDFINVPKTDRLLVLAWMLESFRADTPKPILALCGTQGSAKSSTQDKIRQLIDNNAVNLRAAPKSVEDVFVGAGCNWLVSLNNLSHVSPAMQDALCTLATGGGYASRTLYTNADETVTETKRPVIINSIPSVLTAQDAVDRTICIELSPIAYREECEINAEWELAKPSIFGGLLDLFAKTLAQLPRVKLERSPRMADFTRLGEAMAQALGHQPGTFDALYKANRHESIGRALESSPVAVAISELVNDYDGLSPTVFHGTVSSLLDILTKYKRDSDCWVKSARGLGDVLRRQSPALAAVLGIDVRLGQRVERIGNTRGLTVTILRNGNVGNVGNVGSEFLGGKEKFTPPSSVALEDVEVF